MLKKSLPSHSVPNFNRASRASVVAPLTPLPDEPLTTTWDWAMTVAELSRNVQKVIADWTYRRSSQLPSQWPTVRAAFKASCQTVLYKLSPQDVVKVMATTEHALGWMSGKQNDEPQFKRIKDVSPAYPVIMLLHHLMEKLRRVPTWTDFEKFLFSHPDLCLRYFWSAARISPTTIDQGWDDDMMASIRYRLGNFYYSFLREIHLIAVLRRVYNLDVRYHPILDSEWKVDAVCGPVLLEVYVPSEGLKGKDVERKQTCEQLNPGRPVLKLTMLTKTKGGICWRFNDNEIQEVAMKIRAAGGVVIL